MTERAALPVPLASTVSSDESYPSATILDSRRLTGANWWSAQPGVVLEVRHAGRQDRRALEIWPREVRALYDAMQWPDGAPQGQPHGAIGICFTTAPRDGLLTATSVAEQAWVRAELAVRAQDGDRDAATWLTTSLSRTCDALRARAGAEHTQLGAAVAVLHAADRHASSWQIDDDEVSVGSGPGGLLPRRRLT